MTSDTVFGCVKNSAKNEGSKCSVGEQITPLNLKEIAEVRYQEYDFVIACGAERYCFFLSYKEQLKCRACANCSQAAKNTIMTPSLTESAAHHVVHKHVSLALQEG